MLNSKWSDTVKGAIVGAVLGIIIPVLVWFFYLGNYTEKIIQNSHQLELLQEKHHILEVRFNLITNILTRLLNNIKISQAEKTAIYNEIHQTIKEVNTLTATHYINDDSTQELKKLSDSVKSSINDNSQNIKQ